MACPEQPRNNISRLRGILIELQAKAKISNFKREKSKSEFCRTKIFGVRFEPRLGKDCSGQELLSCCSLTTMATALLPGLEGSAHRGRRRLSCSEATKLRLWLVTESRNPRAFEAFSVLQTMSARGRLHWVVKAKAGLSNTR